MKLSKLTLAYLSNYATINSNLMIRAGSRLTTISEQKNIISAVTVDEEFPVDFGIYDLKDFLSALDLFEEPELNFAEDGKYMEIAENGNVMRFFSAAENMLTFPKKEITFPGSDVEFDFDKSTLDKVRKSAGAIGTSDVSIVGDGSTIRMVVGDKTNSSANTFTIDVGETDKTFDIKMKVDNLKVIPGNYTACFSSKKISQFKHKETDLVYFVAVEADSQF